MIAGAVALGLVIGLTMGALGGGGSVLTVPALVFLLGLSAQAATTASLVIVGVTAAAATVGHALSGNTRWRSGALLALLGVPTSLLGTELNRQVDPDVLLLAFAGLMLTAATGMLVRARAALPPYDAPEPHAATPDGPLDGAAPPDPPATVTTVRTAPPPACGRAGRIARLGLAGLAVGFLTGFFGVGGGFVIVPVLVLLLRTPMPVAVGTSLLVISLACAAALAARAGQGSFAWEVIVPYTLAAVAGSVGGKRIADRTDPSALTVAFAVLLVLVAVYVAVRAGLGLR